MASHHAVAATDSVASPVDVAAVSYILPGWVHELLSQQEPGKLKHATTAAKFELQPA
jgi:hypothetical protein